MTDQVLGILGGMGPAATVEFYRRVTDAVPATTDQDHPRIIIDSNSQVPDRTAALLDGGPDSTPELLRSAGTLAAAGVDLIAIPCNTAHAYLASIREQVAVPVLDMIELTVAASPADGPIGLLATSGTVEIGLYQPAYAARGIEVLVPTPTEQASVMDAIGRVKAGDLDGARAPTDTAVAALAARGAVAVVLGCTEFSVLAPTHRLHLPAIDPLDALTTAALTHLGITPRP